MPVPTGYYDDADPFWQQLSSQTGQDLRDYMRLPGYGPAPQPGEPGYDEYYTPVETSPGSNEWYSPAERAGGTPIQLTPEAVARRHQEAQDHSQQTALLGLAAVLGPAAFAGMGGGAGGLSASNVGGGVFTGGGSGAGSVLSGQSLGAFGASGIPWAPAAATTGTAGIAAGAPIGSALMAGTGVPASFAGGLGALAPGWSPMMPGGSVMAPGTNMAGDPGFFARMGDQLQGGFQNMLHNPDGSINIANALKLGGIGVTGLGMLTGAGSSGDQGPPPGWGDPGVSLPPTPPMNRTQTPYTGDYKSYGKSGGEHMFFQPPVDPMAQAPSADPTGERRGNHMFVPTDDRPISMYGKAEGGRAAPTGRSDDIEALLSEGEYVFDAETVALLGDGSTEAGSDKLDQLRANIRKHKGAALAKGKISPDAKDPMKYLGMEEGGEVQPFAHQSHEAIEDQLQKIALKSARVNGPVLAREDGGQVNPQLGVTELPPVNSNLPAPLPNATGAYSYNRDLAAIQEALGTLGKRAAEPAIGNQMKRMMIQSRKDMDEVARKMLGPQVTEEEMKRFREHFATPENGLAKGGRTLDLRRLQNRRPLAPGREPTNLPPPTTGDRIADVERIRKMIKVMRAQMEPQLPLEDPLKKKDGGAVTEMKSFADKLEAALIGGDQPRLQQLNAQMEGMVPGSVELVKKEYAKGGKVSFSLKHILNTLMGANEPTMGEQIDALKMKDLNAQPLTDEQAIAYLQSLDPTSPVIGQLQERRAVDRDRDILSKIREARAAQVKAQRGTP